MKQKIILIIFIFILPITLKAQLGYNKQIESKDGIDIKYKIVNSKKNDKNSPAALMFLLHNTNDYSVKIKFQIEYSMGVIETFETEVIELIINAKSKKSGINEGLKLELPTNDINIFDNEDDGEWEFSIFEVEKYEKP